MRARRAAGVFAEGSAYEWLSAGMMAIGTRSRRSESPRLLAGIQSRLLQEVPALPHQTYVGKLFGTNSSPSVYGLSELR